MVAEQELEREVIVDLVVGGLHQRLCSGTSLPAVLSVIMSRWKGVCGCREVDLRVGVQGVYVLTYIASSSAFVAQRLSNLLLLSLSPLFPVSPSLS